MLYDDWREIRARRLKRLGMAALYAATTALSSLYASIERWGWFGG